MNNKISLKEINKIKGIFLVPSYQRGYRWGKEEIEVMLDDIFENGEKNYCLQPIVIKKREDFYELVDGQQRLTTLYLIYKYMHNTVPAFCPEPAFKLSYQNRKKSEEFLESINADSCSNENIDFYFMAEAYKIIKNWFSKDITLRVQKIFEYLRYVSVIWYEIDLNEDPVALFKRLNKDKIYLTSSELVKALFIRNSEEKQKDEIALQWDAMEKDLHNESFWLFLTNVSKEKDSEYPTRVDLILDLIAQKKENTKERYFTFFYFNTKIKEGKTVKELWSIIQKAFLHLKDWYEDKELYHKIGYLIASKESTLARIFQEKENKTKKEFKAALAGLIRKSISQKAGYNLEDLDYERDADLLKRILLLFNVESIHAFKEEQRFPFFKYKNCDWTLEHIHARKSEGLTKQEHWKEWLKLHKESIAKIDSQSELLQEIDEAMPNINGKTFKYLQEKVIAKLSSKDDANKEYINSIKNLALLKNENNIALSNAVFSVKRDEIIKMDRRGDFIPFCTRMVFLKSYTPSDKNQLHFWGEADRTAYMEEIRKILAPYLQENN